MLAGFHTGNFPPFWREPTRRSGTRFPPQADAGTGAPDQNGVAFGAEQSEKTCRPGDAWTPSAQKLARAVPPGSRGAAPVRK